MAERLSNIITECLPNGYVPKEALEKLFSHNYLPEQDHDLDFLVEIGNKYDEFRLRIRNFLNAFEKEEDISYDGSFKLILDRTLKKRNFNSFKDMQELYKRNAEEMKIKYGVVEEEGALRSDLWWKFNQVNPTNLCAFWMIKHEANISKEERDFFLGIVEYWPEINVQDSSYLESIKQKCKNVHGQKLSHNFGERKQRRIVAFESGKLKDITRSSHLALHDIDHNIINWYDITQI